METVLRSPLEARWWLAARHALFLGLSLLFASRFFPLLHPTTHCMTGGDPALMCWTLQWVSHALVHEPLRLFEGNIFYPYAHAVALTDAMLPLGVLNVLVRAFTDNPWVGYNLLIVLAYYLSAVSGAWLAEEITGSRLVGFWGGIFWGFLFFRVHHIGHLQILSFQGIPAAIVCLNRWWRNPGAKTALALAAVFVVQALVSWYLAVILTLALLVIAVIRPAAGRLRIDHVRWGLIIVLVAAAVILPLAMAYASAFDDSTLGARKAIVDAQGDSVRPADYLTPPDATFAGHRIESNRYWIWQENTLYIGYTAIILALAGLAALGTRGGPRRWAVAGMALVVVGFVFALGFVSPSLRVRLPLHFLARLIPFLAGLRATQRFSLVVYVGVLVLSSLGLAALLARARRRLARLVLVGAACGLFLFEVFPFYLPFAPNTPWEPSQADRAIAQLQKGLNRRLVVLHLPIYYFVESYPASEATYMVDSTIHWAKLLNGFSGGEPAGFMDRMRLLSTLPAPAAVDELRQLGVDVVAVHAAETPERRARLLQYFRGERGATIVSLLRGEFVVLLAR